MAKKAKSFEQYLVEYIATATVEQTQTALNFFTAIANQKIVGAAPAAGNEARQEHEGCQARRRGAGHHQLRHAVRSGLASSATGRSA